jgi:CRP-like cAMP-binding protein
MTDRRTLVGMLSEVALFEGLSKRDLEKIVAIAREAEARPGEAVVTEGGGGVGFHLILEGRATVTRNGRRIRTLGPGDSFGDIALIDGGARSATVAAETTLRVLSVTSWNFKPLLIERPQIAYKLLLQLCARLRDAEKRPPI